MIAKEADKLLALLAYKRGGKPDKLVNGII